MRSKPGDRIRLQHIVDAIVEIESYLDGVEIHTFLENSMMRFACIKQMEIVGEASNHLSDETRAKLSSIEWGQIVGMRNIFVHEYFGVDSFIVWEIARTDLPDLKQKILAILDSID